MTTLTWNFSSLQMIHNVPQPDFEAFIAEFLKDDPNVEIRKGVAFEFCEQVSSWRTKPFDICTEFCHHFKIATVIDNLQAGNQVITTATVRHTNEQYQIRANYVLGCDGAKSQVRKWLGIESEGEDSCKTPVGTVSDFCNAFKDAGKR